MELASLNRKHEKILQKYVNFLRATVFEATEDYKCEKFMDFNKILKNIIDYTNAFNNILKSGSRRNEWVYMTPNLMLYATMGFLSGIKNNKNEENIDSLSEKIFETTVDFIGETTDILSDIQTKEQIQREILTANNKEQ
jgi:hypothetical protein